MEKNDEKVEILNEVTETSEKKEIPDEQVEKPTEETKIETPEEIVEEAIEETIEESEGEKFEHMLEESLTHIQHLEVGDKVSGEILNITDSYIFITLGGKRDAYAEKADYIDKKGKLPFKIGDTLAGYVVKCSDTETMIAKSLTSVNVNILHEAFEEKIPVSGKVQSLIKGGYIIDISGVKTFCPLSQIDNKLLVEPKKFLNQTFDFVIIDFKDNGRNIVVSRKVILDEEKNKLKEETLKKLEIGSVIRGKVTRLTSFGAFVDLGGVDGLLHISQFSWSRIDSPSEVLNIGDEIESKIIKMKGNKISLSMKALQENPMDIALKELNEGDVVSCRILRNLPFGSFVEIKSGVEGLIPISELARGRRINNPSEVVTEGELVEAQILKINPEKRKISLSLKSLQPDPWDNIYEYVAENDIVAGEIENVVSFGAFIKIRDGITGLLPSSKIKIAGVKLDKSNAGEEFKVRVVKIDTDARRISLEPTNMPESAFDDKDDWHKYKKQRKKKEIIVEDSPFADL